eukprot:XP_016664530.1 PREDICTED: uncharacterized protein LOC100569027 [Acyrthosiphon pisum]
MDEKESCENRFSNLDCPFYQSKYGKLEDKMPKIKYGSINESHYIKKISVLEQQIKNLHSKIHSQGEEQRKYEEKVGEVWHENKNLKKSLEELNALLEKQTEVINYDKVKMMGKDSKIRNLEKEMNARDNKCKSVNRELGIAHRTILDVQKEMGSMKKRTLKNDHMSKFEKDNAELKSKIQDYERNLVYQQKRMNAYENK